MPVSLKRAALLIQELAGGQISSPIADFYPNPIKPNFIGDISIKGLAENVNVKITDISGNLVAETSSNGGFATWNGRNFSGSKVATGVYLVFAANKDGSKSIVGKLLFVN